MMVKWLSRKRVGRYEVGLAAPSARGVDVKVITRYGEFFNVEFKNGNVPALVLHQTDVLDFGAQ